MTTMISAEYGDDDWGPLSELSGHPMMWVLIFSEMVAFGLMLVGFSVARLLNHTTFAAGQARLDPLLGGANTLVLVTSGWLAARAALTARRPHRRLLLLGALSLGLVFVALKLVEYAEVIEAGAGLDTDPFSTLYFLITGFHLLHVVLGVVILAVVAWRAQRDAVEIGTSFWHMIDLVWLVMYPIIYIVR
jgi:nitric oxide reductase NorE protein